MSSAAAVLSNFGSDHWDAELYAVLSLSARLAALLKNRAQTIHLAYQFWRLNSALAGFFDDVRSAMDGKKPASSDVLTAEQLEDGIRTLRKIHNNLETLYEAARCSRLTNNSLVAMPLRSVHSYSDEILDLAELLEIYQAGGSDAVFDRSARERAMGEVYDLTKAQ